MLRITDAATHDKLVRALHDLLREKAQYIMLAPQHRTPCRARCISGSVVFNSGDRSWNLESEIQIISGSTDGSVRCKLTFRSPLARRLFGGVNIYAELTGIETGGLILGNIPSLRQPLYG